MVKRVKKIKVKKPRQPRQRRQGVPRKPPVTNISVNIGGGSNQPSGSYYFPDAQQQVQPLVNNLFTPAPMQPFRPRIEEPIRDVVEMATQTQASVPSSFMPLLSSGSVERLGRPFNPNNKSLAQVQAAATDLGIEIVNSQGKNYTKKQLAKMINV
jgi:hypothetical protein